MPRVAATVLLRLAPELLVVAGVLATAALLALAGGRPVPAAIALAALATLALASAPGPARRGGGGGRRGTAVAVRARRSVVERP